MDVKKLIQKYNITTIYKDGELKIIARPVTKPSKEELEMISANKPAILAEFAAQASKDEEDAKHTHKIILAGWETSTIYVDDRDDINAVIDQAYEAHGEWTGCGRNDIARQINKAVGLDNTSEVVTETKTAAKDDANTFSIIETHKVVQARGGEEGVDGWADVTIRRNSDGATVNVIERNVFDYGHYAVPNGKVDYVNWTELEKQAADWVCKNGPLTCKHMRM